MQKGKVHNPVLPVDYRPKDKGTKEEVTLSFTPCLICKKQIKEGYYGRYGNGGVCSKTCSTVQEGKFKTLGEQHDL